MLFAQKQYMKFLQKMLLKNYFLYTLEKSGGKAFQTEKCNGTQKSP